MNKDVQKGYGDRLRVLRSKKGLTQGDLAKEVKIAPGCINRAEKGRSILSPINRQKVASFFGTDEWLSIPSESQKEQGTYQPKAVDSVKLKALQLAEKYPDIIESLYRAQESWQKPCEKKSGEHCDPMGTGFSEMKKRV